MFCLAPARRGLAPVVAAACGAVLAGVMASTSRAGAAANAEDRAVRTLTLAPGQAFSIAVTVGAIRVTGEAGRRELHVEIVRRGRSADLLTRVPLQLTETPTGPRLVLTQADGAADPGLQTDVAVVAPENVRLDALSIAEGQIDLRHLHGEVRASVARGRIVADDVSGVVRLETTLGPVEVTRGRLDAGGLFRLRAFNGDVRLALTAPLVDTRVLALALNGTITSTQPLTMKDGWGPRWGEATVGRPDRLLSIDVVSGAIRLEAPEAR